MEYLPISIGQAGNQINYELSNIFFDLKKNNEELFRSYTTIDGKLAKSILIDTETKVIDKYFKKNNPFSKYYAPSINVVTNQSGRGNNWALGYSNDYVEYKGFNSGKSNLNISIECCEMIRKFLEKCEFLNGFLFIHSLNGGTGSGVTTRVAEILKDEYPKFKFISCPVIGLTSNNYIYNG